MRTEQKTILLIDDQESTLFLLKSEMEDHGYRVLTARQGADALRICSHSAFAVDLAILDVCLTADLQLAQIALGDHALNGIDLATHIKQVRPSAQLLFMSGLSREALESLAGDSVSAPVLAKPLSPSMVLEIIRLLLTRRPGDS